jgi:hypothetical protein
MTDAVKRAENALRAAVAKTRNYDSPKLSAEDRAALAKIARSVSKRLESLSPRERRLALQ